MKPSQSRSQFTHPKGGEWLAMDLENEPMPGDRPRCEACGQFTRDGFCTTCDAVHDHACCPPDDCCGGPCAAHPCWDLTT